MKYPGCWKKSRLSDQVDRLTNMNKMDLLRRDLLEVTMPIGYNSLERREVIGNMTDWIADTKAIALETFNAVTALGDGFQWVDLSKIIQATTAWGGAMNSVPNDKKDDLFFRVLGEVIPMITRWRFKLPGELPTP